MGNDNSVETEEHMIVTCPAYSILRSELHLKLNGKIDFSATDHVFSLMKSTDEKVIFYFSKYISKCFRQRKEKLSEI